jgi:hypothetical protein
MIKSSWNKMKKADIGITVLILLFAAGALFGLRQPKGWSNSDCAPAMKQIQSTLAAISPDSIKAELNALCEIRTREFSSKGALRAALHISGALMDSGLDVQHQYVRTSGGGGNSAVLTNVVARFPQVESADSILLLCAHFDAIAGMPGESAPGADDNASGCAILLEIARVLSRLADEGANLNIELVFFGGEEDSFIGSRAFVDGFEKSGRRLIGAINMDMVGYDREGPKDFVVFTNRASHRIADILQDCSSRLAYLRCDTTITAAANSDHGSFWNKGLRAVSVWEGYDHDPYYHSMLDEPEILSPKFMAGIARVIACAAIQLGVR